MDDLRFKVDGGLIRISLDDLQWRVRPYITQPDGIEFLDFVGMTADEVGRAYDVDEWEGLSDAARRELCDQLIRAGGPKAPLD